MVEREHLPAVIVSPPAPQSGSGDKKPIRLDRAKNMEPNARTEKGTFVIEASSWRLVIRQCEPYPPLSQFSRLIGVFVCFWPRLLAAEPSPGFAYCAPPSPPNCVGEPSKPSSPTDCEAQVQAYVASVFRFRECLDAESEREVRRANEILEQWRCKRSGKACRL